MFKFILRGININVKDKDRKIALYYTAAKGHLVYVRVLLKDKVSIDALNSAGKSPVIYTLDNNRVNIVNIIRSYKTTNIDVIIASIIDSIINSPNYFI